MRISIGPAKRDGRSKVVFDRPIEKTEIHRDPSGQVRINLVASGIYDTSRYRYSIELDESEVGSLGVHASAETPQRPVDP
jgi:hypothetical protein